MMWSTKTALEDDEEACNREGGGQTAKRSTRSLRITSTCCVGPLFTLS